MPACSSCSESVIANRYAKTIDFIEFTAYIQISIDVYPTFLKVAGKSSLFVDEVKALCKRCSVKKRKVWLHNGTGASVQHFCRIFPYACKTIIIHIKMNRLSRFCLSSGSIRREWEQQVSSMPVTPQTRNVILVVAWI